MHSMDLPTANRHLAGGDSLSREQMQSVMQVIMRGEATPAQIGAFLMALTIKGETVEELTGAALVMRKLAARVEVQTGPVVDTVGTGGDSAGLFNVSTASALVASAAGVCMAKHGSRAATGNSGSADVLEAAGVNIAITAQQVGRCIDECGIGFMFAPSHHAAMRHAIGPRREIGVRSIFNLLGPLTNPAGARRQLVGVFAQQWLTPMAAVFGELGSEHTLVVCSDDGLDEISVAAPTRVAELRHGKITEYGIAPAQFDLPTTALDGLKVADAQQSLALIRQALRGQPGATYNMVALNAGATLYVGGRAGSIADGVTLAQRILSSGTALDKLEQLARFTQAIGDAAPG